MKIKNYVFGGVAVAILGCAGISSAQAAVKVASTNYIDTRVGDVKQLHVGLGDNTVDAINALDDDVTQIDADLATLEATVNGALGEGGSIDGSNIEAGSIGSDQLGSNSVTSDKIAQGAVGTNELADNSVTSEKIKDGEVKTNDLATGAVTSEKIADGTIQQADLDTTLQGKINAIDGKEAVANKVTETTSLESYESDTTKYPSMAAAYAIAKAVAGVSDGGKINGSNIADGSVGTTQITNNAITYEKLAQNSVKSDNIVDGEVKTVDIADANVTEPKLADNAVSSRTIAQNAVTVEKLSNDLQASLAGLTTTTKCSDADLCVLSFNGSTFVWTGVAETAE